MTLNYFSIRKSNRYLAKHIWELKSQLQQLQQGSESAQKVTEKETVSDPAKEDKQRTSTERSVSHEEKDIVTPKPESIQEPPSVEPPTVEMKPSVTDDETMKENAVDEKPSEPTETGKKVSKPITSRGKRGRTRIDWELLIGGRWLNRIGALAIIIGLIFFIKYAFDHELINNEMKVTLVILTGCSFLWGGRYFHRKQLPIFAQGLIGTGIASFYLSVYAAHNFYHLIDGTLAFLFMSLFTLLAFQQALSYNALAVSLLGWCGGYLTPFLVSVNETSAKGLFLYLAFLSLGMILVAIKKRNWSILYHLTVVATYFIFFLYLINQPEPSEWLLRIGFLLIYWAIFYGYELYYLTRHNQWPIAKEIMAMIHSLILYGGLVGLLLPHHSEWVLESLILAGIGYLLPLIVLDWRKKLSQVFENQVIRFGLTFCLFLNIAPLYHWERFELVLVWIIQAALLIGWATRKRLQWLTLYTMGLLGVVSVTLLTLSSQHDFYYPITNLQFLSYLGLTGVFLYGAIRQHQNHVIKQIFQIAWATTFLIGFSFELSTLQDYIQRSTAAAFSDEVTFLYGLVLFTSWIVYSLFLTRMGIWKQIRSLIVTSWFVLAIGTLGLAMVAISGPIELFTIIFWSRIPIFCIALIVVYFHYRWHRDQDQRISLACLYGGILLGFELLTISIIDYFHYQITTFAQIHLCDQIVREQRQSLFYTKWVCLWMGWILYSFPLLWYGWKRKIRSLIDLSTIFYGLCIFGIFIYGLQFKPITQFVPVWNLRFLLFLVAAFVTYRFYHVFYKKGGQKRIEFIFILLILFFTLIHVEINDYFRNQLLQLSPVQTWEVRSIKFTHPLSLATIWVLFSLPLMWLGFRHQRKWMISTAWVVLGISLFFVMILSFTFSPITHFTPLFNRRSLFLLIAVAALFIHLAWNKKMSSVRSLCSIIISILLFELITVEINDVFRFLISQDQQGVHALLNLKQLSFSSAWMMYAILLFTIGLWRKFPSLRWIAMGLFGVSIFKIFLYDLAFLDTLYRIFLFIGLGIVLLLVSYIYQRYKHLFTSSDDEDSI